MGLLFYMATNNNAEHKGSALFQLLEHLIYSINVTLQIAADLFEGKAEKRNLLL